MYGRMNTTTLQDHGIPYMVAWKSSRNSCLPREIVRVGREGDITLSGFGSIHDVVARFFFFQEQFVAVICVQRLRNLKWHSLSRFRGWLLVCLKENSCYERRDWDSLLKGRRFGNSISLSSPLWQTMLRSYQRMGSGTAFHSFMNVGKSVQPPKVNILKEIQCK